LILARGTPARGLLPVSRKEVHMAIEDHEARKRKILKAIIQSHISTAEPIGSRTIWKIYRLGISPATIRNVMAELEEAGLIMQPHASAGRIPTDRGYRYYVDTLMEMQRITKEEEERIRKEYSTKLKEVEDVMRKTCRLLSEITEQAALFLLPRMKRALFKRIELISIDNSTALAILMTDTGLVRNAVMEIEDGITQEDLSKISRFLNRELNDVSLSDVKNFLLRRALAEKDSFFYLYKRAMEIAHLGSFLDYEDRLWLDGTSYILEQPEFKDLKKMRILVRALEGKRDLLDILIVDADEEGTRVHIGSEIEYSDINSCSLVVASYKVRGRIAGTLGVIGPMRMEYAKVIPIVSYVADIVGKRISEIAY
jgi:heat-inducible transcriptional repressor